jgi:hypothetical protein
MMHGICRSREPSTTGNGCCIAGPSLHAQKKRDKLLIYIAYFYMLAALFRGCGSGADPRLCSLRTVQEVPVWN